MPSSTFTIQPVAELDSAGIDVAVDDVLFNPGLSVRASVRLVRLSVRHVR
jgi:hypothetical protein